MLQSILVKTVYEDFSKALNTAKCSINYHNEVPSHFLLYLLQVQRHMELPVLLPLNAWHWGRLDALSLC